MADTESGALGASEDNAAPPPADESSPVEESVAPAAAAPVTLGSGEAVAVSRGSAAAVTTPLTLAGARRSAWGLIGTILLLVVVLSGSVLAANGLASMGSVAPDAPLWSVGLAGPQQLSRATKPGSGSTSAPCNCSSQKASYAPPPYLGQVVVVSISQQELWAYQDDQLILTTQVTTGMPQLPTPTGTFHIMMKESNVWFYSPWPQGSPYYYTPEFIPYAMLFLGGGFYLHAASWRDNPWDFGPGTNVPHTKSDGTYSTGSHGCVNLPTSVAGQLYAWIGNGATVVIKY